MWHVFMALGAQRCHGHGKEKVPGGQVSKNFLNQNFMRNPNLASAPGKNYPLVGAKIIQFTSMKFALFCTQEWTILVGLSLNCLRFLVHLVTNLQGIKTFYSAASRPITGPTRAFSPGGWGGSVSQDIPHLCPCMLITHNTIGNE